ncbi:CPBP family glutamic-type intramembrane protease [uncultured Maritimibacter sp.]|uniref:CPBP family glutamic-type intramembrane protease n=1 Tax=uncultured Maritimibacter sp. TaxID=991866 RepID=UPI0026078FB7|nr:CPBP family glutamic-type intramembrane protease [uncultured Maritimibacter sp.]
MTKVAAADRSDFFFFERTDSDLPFYRGVPVGFGPGGWLIVFASVAVAYFVLLVTQQLFTAGAARFLPAVLFTLIPLANLAAIAGRRAPLALFRGLRGWDPVLIIGFFVLNFAVTVVLGLLVSSVVHAVSNPAGAILAGASTADRLFFFAAATVQLLGEEIFTILPFLGFPYFLDRVIGRKAAICVAALGASIIFALIHLPTYQWNVPQALIGLVPVRIILLLPFIITRNIWVSTGVHVMNDWTIFGGTLLQDTIATG